MRALLAYLGSEWANAEECVGPAPAPPSGVFSYNGAGPFWELTLTTNEPGNVPHRFDVSINHGAGFVPYGTFIGSPSVVQFAQADWNKAIRYLEVGNGVDFCGNSLGVGDTIPPEPPAGAGLTVDSTVPTVDSTTITSDQTVW